MATLEEKLAKAVSDKQSLAAETNKEENSYDNLQLIVIRIGDVEYGINIDQIKEVVITPPISRLPNTPSYVKGVANIRGNIIAIIDLEERFNLKEESAGTKATKSNYTLVAESERIKIGILVEEVPQTLAISEKDVDLSPDIAYDDKADERYIKGIVKDKDRLIILIDLFELATAEEEELATA